MRAANKQTLRSLAHSQFFPVLEALRDELTAKWYGERATGESEFAYLKDSLMRDGKIEGVLAFIHNIESAALEE